MSKDSDGGGYWESIGRGKREILNVHERVAQEQGPLPGLITRIGLVLASPGFFLALFVVHAAWVVINHPAISPIDPFDPPPYMLLATIASVEAPFLSLLILMRQARDRKIAELRQETALQVELHGERETSALVTMVEALCRRLEVEHGVDRRHLQAMQEPLDAERLFEVTREELEQSEEHPGQGGGDGGREPGGEDEGGRGRGGGDRDSEGRDGSRA